MKKRMVAVLTGLLVVAVGVGTANASAKYMTKIPTSQVKSCSLCHSTPPALNATGTKFVKAGHSFSFLTAKTAVKPVAKKVTKPVAKKVTKPVAKKVTKPVAKKVTKPVAKKVTKPVAKKVTKPVVKKVTKPVAKPVAPDKATVAATQWAKSKHAGVIVESDTPANDQPNARGTCSKCHTAEGFLQYTAEVKKVGGFDKTFMAKSGDELIPASMTLFQPNPYLKPAAIATCEACHNGKTLRVSGVVGLQTTAGAGKPGYDKPLMMVNAGQAASCFICHDYRKGPGKLDPANPGRITAAHAAGQTELLLGFGGKEFAGQIYQSSPHGAIENSCVTCHMAKGSHTYKPSIVACQKCHSGLTTFNRLAGGDYDGDKKIEGIQDEVKGLANVLNTLINEKLGYPNAYATSWGGSVNIFEDKNHTSPNDPLAKCLNAKAEAGEWVADGNAPFWKNPDAAKIADAYYNMFLVEEEGSWGIHNPVYAVQLLQSSYRNLAGTDVPNARIR